MKFFTEFGSCFTGGSASEDANHLQRTADVSSGMSRRLARSRSCGGAAATWKPKLAAISEDSPMTTAEDPTAAGDYGRKQTAKPTFKSTVVIAPGLSHGEDYWKSLHTPTLPAFSPMWFAL